MASKGFKRLDQRVAREYRDKGYSESRAAYIGRAVAGMTAYRKWRKAGSVPLEVKRQRACVAAAMRGRHFDSRAAAEDAFAASVERCAERERRRVR